MKKVIVNIAEEDLKLLKENRYALCIAFREKDMGYDMVCYSCMDYLLNNSIEITEEFSVFYCKNIQFGEKVVVSGGPYNIQLGQRITIDEYGSFKDIENGFEGNRIEIINEYGNLYLGFSRKIIFSGIQSTLPAFVSPYISLKGEFTFEPEDMMRIWFEQFAN